MPLFPPDLSPVIDRLVEIFHDIPSRFLYPIIALVPVGLYLGIVRSLRWKRYYAIHAKYQSKYEDQTLTVAEAQEVMKLSNHYDMPFLMRYSLAFALFKTYAIPSISKLLLTTGELMTENVSRRYADTTYVIATFVACPLSGFAGDGLGGNGKADPRGLIALARTNWLHSKYNISNGDYLYTLSLFITAPVDWSRRFGWRPLSPLEEYSYFLVWADIGRKMGIKDIPANMEDLRAWSQEYEERFMVPAMSNKQVAECTKDELLYPAPHRFGLRSFADRILICVLEERVRIAMMQPEQPRLLQFLVHCLMKSAGVVQKWFLLPRSDNNPNYPIKSEMPKIGNCPFPRMHPTSYAVKPWYKPERTGLGSYVDSLEVRLGLHDEVPAPHLKSNGYRLEEMGPIKFENSGHEEVMRIAAELQGCPVTGPWSLEGRK